MLVANLNWTANFTTYGREKELISSNVQLFEFPRIDDFERDYDNVFLLITIPGNVNPKTKSFNVDEKAKF